MVGKYIKKGSYVIYESTTYPGCTEEECIPIIEEISKLKLSKDFYCGYSPERINPGDKVNTITKLKILADAVNYHRFLLITYIRALSQQAHTLHIQSC